MHRIKFSLKMLAVVFAILVISNIATADEKPEVFAQLGHLGSVKAVAFSPDGKYVISGSGNHTINPQVKIWDSGTGKEIRTFNGFTYEDTRLVTISPDNKYALALSMSELKAWDILKGKEILTISSLSGAVWAAFSPDGKTISVLSSGTLDIWEISSGLKIKTIKGFSESDRRNSSNKYFFKDKVVYDAITGEPAKRGGPVELGYVDYEKGSYLNYYTRDLPAFSDDCAYAALGRGNTIALWDFNNKRKPISVIKITGRLLKVYISHDGEFVGAIVDIRDNKDEKYVFRVWEFNGGKKISNIILQDLTHCFVLVPVAPSPDWNHVVIGYEDGSVKILDIATGKEIIAFVAKQDEQEMMAIHFDRYLMTSNWTDHRWVIWDIHAGTIVKSANEEMPREKLMSYVNKKSINKKGNVLCASSAVSLNQNHSAESFNGTVKLFDSKTGKEIAQFITFKDGEWVVITPEGYYNASPNGAKHINVRIGNNVYGIEDYSENLFRPDLVKAALAKKDKDGWAALMGAVKDGDTETVKVLLAKGADANAKNNDSETVLMFAARNGHTETVEALLAKGADVNAKNKYGRRTALIIAARNGHTEIVKALLAKGADVNAKDDDGETVLMFAVRYGYTEIVKVLLAKGADANAKDDDGETVLMFAALGGSVKTVKALLAKGADIGAKDDNGKTALMYAAASNRRSETVKALLAKGADVNAKDKDGKTALMCAAFGGRTETVKALLAKGADINAKNEWMTVLMCAAFGGRTETVKALLAKGADINAKNESEMTALMFAARNGRTEIVKALLAKGADVNVKDRSGKTALMCAKKKGHTEIVRILKQAGARE